PARVAKTILLASTELVSVGRTTLSCPVVVRDMPGGDVPKETSSLLAGQSWSHWVKPSGDRPSFREPSHREYRKLHQLRLLFHSRPRIIVERVLNAAEGRYHETNVQSARAVRDRAGLGRTGRRPRRVLLLLRQERGHPSARAEGVHLVGCRQEDGDL